MRNRHPALSLALIGAVAGAAALAPAACAAAPPAKPLTLAPKVDIPGFMGAWYVIGVIPTRFDKDAYNAVERYALRPDGRIDIVYSYRDGSFAGEAKTMNSIGSVEGGNGAIWGVQFIWPIKADYRVMYLSDDARTVVIGREKRDYVWIMSRVPTLPDADYQRLTALIAAEGYDTAKLIRSPQRW